MEEERASVASEGLDQLHTLRDGTSLNTFSLTVERENLAEAGGQAMCPPRPGVWSILHDEEGRARAALQVKT